jgi:hypothetical protein
MFAEGVAGAMRAQRVLWQRAEIGVFSEAAGEGGSQSKGGRLSSRARAAREGLSQRVSGRTDEELEGRYARARLSVEVARGRVQVIGQETLARGTVSAAHVVGGALIDAAEDLSGLGGEREGEGGRSLRNR